MEQEKHGDFKTVRGYQLENADKNKLTSAMEDYLEMTFRLCREDGYARVGRLAEELQVKPSSASKMVAKLTAMGYLRTDRNDSILLTQAGFALGGYLLARHKTVEQFLRLLQVDAPLREAEMLEHTIEPGTVKKLRKLLEFFEANPTIRALWEGENV